MIEDIEALSKKLVQANKEQVGETAATASGFLISQSPSLGSTGRGDQEQVPRSHEAKKTLDLGGRGIGDSFKLLYGIKFFFRLSE